MKEENKRAVAVVIVIIMMMTIIYMITKQKKKVTNDEIERNIITEQYMQNLEDGTKLNTSTKLNETKEFQGLKISNIQFTNKDNKTELIAEVENTTNHDTQAMLVDIILYDKEGNQMATIGGRISPIRKGKKIQFHTVSTIDYSNAYDFELQLK